MSSTAILNPKLCNYLSYIEQFLFEYSASFKISMRCLDKAYSIKSNIYSILKN